MESIYISHPYEFKTRLYLNLYRTETKVGHSDPGVPCGRALAQRIKGTPGITG
jgi:hypothetical protein